MYSGGQPVQVFSFSSKRSALGKIKKQTEIFIFDDSK
ncbi:hypothetical protein GGQ60_000032 [Pedobacter zeae]|uniref:Uncharacterized protein n=1 Tax=Pedobacter zeae TaxID=1737356 RepID=A0A7W6P3N3_9SPHI|nr:hypothetical protein [Pedobacter zeae]